MTERRIDPETLAALLDGRLEGSRRDEVLAALAEDDAAYEAYAEAVAVTGEMEAERDAERVRPIQAAPSRGRSYHGRRLLMAAAIAGLLVVPWAIYRSQSPETGPAWVMQTLDGSTAGVPAGWNAEPWGARRSGAAPLTAGARAARVGSRLVDLELAVRAGDAAETRAAADAVAGLLDSLPAAGPAAGVYRNIAARAGEPHAQLESLMDRGRAAATLLLDEDQVAMGAWTEAGRIAAARRDSGFFSDAESRVMLERLSSDASLSEPAREAAGRASAAAAATPPRWEAVSTSLEELLAELGRG